MSKTRRNDWKVRVYRTLFVVWCLIMLVLTIIPSVESPLPNLTYLDKIAHIGQFFIFSLLFYMLRVAQNIKDKKIIRELFKLSLTLPVLTEALQIPVPGRRFCLLDIVANFIGISLMITYIKVIKTNKLQLRDNEEEQQMDQ